MRIAARSARCLDWSTCIRGIVAGYRLRLSGSFDFGPTGGFAKPAPVPVFQKPVAPRVPISTEPVFGPVARPSVLVERLHKPVFIAFLACMALNIALLALQYSGGPTGREPDAWEALGRWPEGLLSLTGLATSMLALGRRLPFQNVLMAAMLITFLAGVILGVGAWSGVPFGPVHYTENAGNRILELLPWSLPLWWVALLMNARGVARLIMRPWRRTSYYGFWVIGLAAAMITVLDLSLEPFAVFVRDYWLWKTPRTVPSWYTAPWVNSLAWFVTAAAILLFTVPWLINKNPVKRPLDYHPLIVWLLLTAWITLGNATQGCWRAVAVAVASGTVTALCAVRGARWGSA